MKTNIEIYTSEIFGEIRTCQVNNQIMFVGKDVAQALGYAKPQNALATHVDEEDKTTAPIQGTGSNYITRVTIINESGLYALILSSKLPQAKAFKRWVTHTAVAVKELKVARTEGQLDALVSLAFNIGIEALKRSTLLRVIRAHGSKNEIRREFRRWVYCKGKVLPGLVKRREWEAKRFFE